MIGIIVIGHAEIAQGILSAAQTFVPELPQVEAVSLHAGDSPEDFALRLAEAIERNDTGDGVILLADIKGGTPCNQAACMATERVRVLAGISLTLFIELFFARLSCNDINVIVPDALEAARLNMVDMNVLMQR